MSLAPTQSTVETPSRAFYREAMLALNRAGVPFLVGGAFAFARYSGIRRETKDFDVFIHRRDLQRAFAAGDFSTPAFVHMRDVPGARVMAARRAMISYRYADLPRGGELRIKSSDPEAVVAVHEFLAFQRKDHHARGGPLD